MCKRVYKNYYNTLGNRDRGCGMRASLIILLIIPYAYTSLKYALTREIRGRELGGPTRPGVSDKYLKTIII